MVFCVVPLLHKLSVPADGRPVCERYCGPAEGLTVDGIEQVLVKGCCEDSAVDDNLRRCCLDFLRDVGGESLHASSVLPANLLLEKKQCRKVVYSSWKSVKCLKITIHKKKDFEELACACRSGIQAGFFLQERSEHLI